MRNIIKALFVYGLFCLFMFLLQDRLLYSTDKNLKAINEYNIAEHGFYEVRLKTHDLENLVLWYKKPSKFNSPTIIYFHGNAGNIAWRSQKYIKFTQESGYGLLALSYRGYGRSSGNPSEEGLYIDAQAAVRFLQEQGVQTEDIILYGESLGSAVATELAVKDQFKALILEAPFTSLPDIAQQKYWYIPARFLVKEKYNTLAKIPNIHTPLLIFHGVKDRLVPIENGKKIFKAANYPKDMIVFNEKGHSDFNDLQLIEELQKFIVKINR
jgi:fermentation-respiration switch protein FrsA (DUF1100 family)